MLKGQLQVSSHVESVFWVFVTAALEQLLEAFDGVGKFHKETLLSGEDLRHVEWLGKESLDFSGASNGQLVVF